MKKNFLIGFFSLMFLNQLAIGEELNKSEESLLGRGSLSARLVRQARQLDRDVSRSYYSYEVREAARSFKNSATRLYNCESGDRGRYDRYCDREFDQTEGRFRRLERSFRRGRISYDIEESLRTIRRILRSLGQDYRGGRDPYPGGQYVCIAEAEEGWNTRPVRGGRSFSLSEAKESALRNCERFYDYCFVKSCERM